MYRCRQSHEYLPVLLLKLKGKVYTDYVRSCLIYGKAMRPILWSLFFRQMFVKWVFRWICV